MSRSTYSPGLRAALDRFEVGSARDGFADRIMRAVAPVPRLSARDRRGGWRLARRALFATVAAGLVSAAAVASGLLGAAGIRVPVLTAMLAPAPSARPATGSHPVTLRAAAAPKARHSKAATMPGAVVDPATPAPVVPLRPPFADVTARRAERRAFLDAHPELRPVLRQAIRRERAFVREYPEVRALRRLPPADRRAFLADRPDLRAAMIARREERRAFRAANPDAAAALRDRFLSRRAGVAPVVSDAPEAASADQ